MKLAKELGPDKSSWLSAYQDVGTRDVVQVKDRLGADAKKEKLNRKIERYKALEKELIPVSWLETMALMALLETIRF